MPSRAPIVTRQTTSGENTENLNKGSALTFEELDKNFIGLRDQTIGIVGDDSTGIDVRAGDTIKFTGSGGATVSASGDTVTITAGGGGGTSDSFKNIAVSGQSTVVADSSTDTLTLVAGTGMTITTDAGTDTITFTSSGGATTGNLTFEKSTGTTADALGVDTIATGASNHDMYFKTSGNGTYNFINTTSTKGLGVADGGLATGGIASGELTALTSTDELYLVPTNDLRVHCATTRFGGGGTNVTLTTNGANDLILNTNSGTNTGSITIADGLNNDITVFTSGSGDIILNYNTGNLIFESGGTQRQFPSFGSPGFLYWNGTIMAWNNSVLQNIVEDTTPQLGGSLDVNGQNIVSVSGGNISILPNTTGNIILDNHTWPNSDGTTGQVLSTNGAGVLSWVTADVVNDTTPQLGGNLDVNSNDIVSVSNGNIKLLPNGTGRVIIGTDPTGGSTGFYGNNSVYGAQMNYRDADWNAATGPQYPNPIARTTDWKLDASTTTNGRIRMVDAVELDMAGYNWNFSPDRSAGPSHKKAVVLKNTGSSASNTLENAIVQSNNVEILGSGSNNSTITVNNIIGNRVLNFASQDSGDTTNIGADYGYLYQSPANFGSGTLNVTNEYGVYIDQASSTATNNYGIYHKGSTDYAIYVDSNAPNNRIGGLQFQFNRIKFPDASTPSTVSTLAWLYGDNSSGTQELYVKDGAGNVTQLSPHNAQGEWEYFSRNTDTGKVVRINMEEMIRDLEQLTGKTYIKNE